MKKFFVLTEILVSLLFLVGIAHSERTIWYVHPDSSLNSIQAGLDSCANNDVVLVAPGIYYENIVWPNTQGIHLISELGLETTIIDGDSAGSVIEIDSVSEVDSSTIINGFTIRNGYSFISAGGGILLRRSSPIIKNNLITHNRAFLGAGIVVSLSSAIIINNTITRNIADNSGGGIFCGGTTSPRITGNLITDNMASSFGAGIFCRSDSAIISDNIITGNSAGQGGGICCITSFCIITGNSITGNTADFGGGISCVNCAPSITGNTITDNTANEHGGGIHCFIDASPYIDSCTISNNNCDGVYSAWYSTPVINYNNITDNFGYGVINVDSSVIIDARYNWWGDASGPSGFGPGTGDSVSQYVDYDPWLDHPAGIKETDDSQQMTEIRRQLLTYPNPFTSVTSVQLIGNSDKQKVSLGVYDVSGRLVKSVPLITNHLTIGTDLSPGVYFLKADGFDVGKVIKLR